MSQYYTAQRTRNRYDPASPVPFRLSRSKLDLFLNCPRCFYLDCKRSLAQPPGYQCNRNNAVDKLLKKEFDIHRARKTRHPLMERYGVDAVPFDHPQINHWREARTAGITFHHTPTNFFITGGIDDVWVDPYGELIIVDYKATSKNGEVNIDAEWQIGYKRQMEVYQWLFRKNGFDVSKTGYFVYANGNTDKEAFDGKLEFDVKLIPYEGDDGWVEQALSDAHRCLGEAAIPPAGPGCEFCEYRAAAANAIPALAPRK